MYYPAGWGGRLNTDTRAKNTFPHFPFCIAIHPKKATDSWMNSTFLATSLKRTGVYWVLLGGTATSDSNQWDRIGNWGSQGARERGWGMSTPFNFLRSTYHSDHSFSRWAVESSHFQLTNSLSHAPLSSKAAIFATLWRMTGLLIYLNLNWPE